MKKQEEFNAEIRGIFTGGRVKKIKWGADSDKVGWAVWSDKQRLEYAIALAEAMNQAADVMQKERNALLLSNNKLTDQLEQADKAVEINKTIMQNSLTARNIEIQKFNNEIQKLKTEIAVLKAVEPFKIK